MTRHEKIKQAQQPRDLGYSPNRYVRLLDQLYLLLFDGAGDQFAFDYKRDQRCRESKDN